MKHPILSHRKIQVCAALIAADCLVFSFVDPDEASSYWLIIGYALLAVTLLGLMSLLADAFKGYGDAVYTKSRRLLRYGAVIGIVAIGLQSIGQLTIRDVMTFLPLAVIAYLYFGYGKKVAPDST